MLNIFDIIKAESYNQAMKDTVLNFTVLGTLVKKARLSAGLTQAELADRAQVSRATIISLENKTIKELGVNRLRNILNASGDKELSLMLQFQAKPRRHEIIDQEKLDIARKTVCTVSLNTIRQKSLETLERWERNGLKASAIQEWRSIMLDGDDTAVLNAMIGDSERSNRLRQSPPYTGLLTRQGTGYYPRTA